jgi:hypothetical protein
MALSPKELGKLTEEELVDVAKAEEEIDEFLKIHYWGADIYILFSVPLSFKQRYELEKRYLAVGWKSAKVHATKEGKVGIVLSEDENATNY